MTTRFTLMPSPVIIRPMSAAAHKPPEHNQTGIDYRRLMPRPPVRGTAIDGHCHLLARRHCRDWFEAAAHYGWKYFISQGPLEEALIISRDRPEQVHFVAVPNWQKLADFTAPSDWHRRIEGFYNLGSRMAKIHLAPGTMQRTGFRFDDPRIDKILADIASRGMIIMTHMGDPQLWYDGKYKTDPKFTTDNPHGWDSTFLSDRELHYKLFEQRLEQYRGHPWLCAHLGGWPENLAYMQTLLDRFPDLFLDLSATKWMVRELSRQRDAAREFIIRNADRILWGSDQVSGDTRDWDFFASRWWCHRKLFETGYHDTSPIYDPDCPPDAQPILRGLALPDPILQKIYHDTAVTMMRRVGVEVPELR
jgi:hypothetical protein